VHSLDIIFGIFLLIFALKCMFKGFVASVIQLLGLIVIVFTIAKAGQFVKLIVIEKLGWGETISTIVSYILIAVIILFMIKFIIFLMNRVVEVLNLKWLNKLLGAFFGILNGLLLIAVLIIITDVSPLNRSIRRFTKGSYIVRTVRIITDEIETKYPQVGKLKEPLKKKLKKQIEKGKEKTEETLDEKIKEKVEEAL